MNSNKRMTLDELILWCKGRAMHHEDSHDHSRASGYRRVMKFITDNKPALIRGMQKPLPRLRFRIYYAAAPDVWYADILYPKVDDKDEEMTWLDFICSAVDKDSIIEECKISAEAMGLPCEFIEDTA